MKNLLIILIVLGLLGGGYFLMKKSSPSVSVAPISTQSVPAVSTNPGPVKEFTVEGGMYYFNPKEIRVKKGDTVKIVFTNKEGTHDWVLDEFNVKTKMTKLGESDTVTFVADKTGTFEYYCSVGSHRALGMKGNLIVE